MVWMWPLTASASETTVFDPLMQVEAGLRSADVSMLSSEQAAHRADLLDVLNQYRLASEFPRHRATCLRAMGKARSDFPSTIWLAFSPRTEARGLRQRCYVLQTPIPAPARPS